MADLERWAQMTEKQKARLIAFLRDKSRLIQTAYGRPIKSDDRLLAEFESTPAAKLRRSALRDFDGDTELAWREGLGREAMREIADTLRRSHGFARIAADPDLVIARVLKRRDIRTDDELRTILDHLAFVDNHSTEEERSILHEMVKFYEEGAQSTRRS